MSKRSPCWLWPVSEKAVRGYSFFLKAHSPTNFFPPVKLIACLTGTVSSSCRSIFLENYDFSLSFFLRKNPKRTTPSTKINTFKHLPMLWAIHILQCIPSNLQLLNSGIVSLNLLKCTDMLNRRGEIKNRPKWLLFCCICKERAAPLFPQCLLVTSSWPLFCRLCWESHLFNGKDPGIGFGVFFFPIPLILSWSENEKKKKKSGVPRCSCRRKLQSPCGRDEDVPSDRTQDTQCCYIF